MQRRTDESGSERDRRWGAGVVRHAVLALLLSGLIGVAGEGTARARTGGTDTSGTASSQATPATRALPPGTTNHGWAAEWMIGVRSVRYSKDEAVEMARRYDVLISMPWTYKRHVDEMRAANPDLQLFVYVNGPFAPGWLDYPDWLYAKNAAGERVNSVRFGNPLMKVHTTRWRNELVTLCADALDESKADGCFFDTMGSGFLTSGYLDSDPIDPRTGAVWDPDTFIRDTSAAIRHVADRLDIPTAANGLGNGGRYLRDDAHVLASSTDLAMAESFLRHPTAAVDAFPAEGLWRKEVEMIRDVEARGGRMLGVTKLWVESTEAQRRQWHDYALATLLLASDGSSRLFLLEDGCRTPCDWRPSPLLEQPVSHVRVGTPTAAMADAGDHYARPFQDGLVLVNPHSTSARRRLIGTWYDQHGRRLSGTITIPAQHGLILTPEPADGSDDVGQFSCLGRPATIVGTTGDDDIVGTEGADVIVGLGGNDRIDGLGGDDVICGGDGTDRILGGGGDDDIEGGGHGDRVEGGAGADSVRGGSGNDVVFGGAGPDVLSGGLGDDRLVGNEGDDDLRGGDGQDTCNGGYHVEGDRASACETTSWVELVAA